MNKNHKEYNEVNNYLSIKRAALLSLAITFAYYLLFMLTHFFGRPALGEFDRSQEQNRAQTSTEVGVNDATPQDGEWFAVPDEPGRRGGPGGPPPDRPRGPEPQERSPYSWWNRMFVSALPTFVLVFVVMLFNRRIMSIRFKKHSHELVCNIFGTIFVGLVLSALGTLFQKAIVTFVPGPPRPIWHHIGFGWMTDFPLIALAIITSYLLRSLYKEKVAAVENETLRAESMVSRFEALKNQLDPHFLFNSLNTLKSLITIDANKAENYVQQLSTVLRFTLQRQEVVTLAEELKSTADYCRMLKIRYGDNLQFDHHIDHGRYDNYLVLPLAIQGLVENAIKHNVISTKQPLLVHISTDDDGHLIVSNRIQPKVTKEEGGGIGLANLVERYRLRWNEKVEIFNDGKNFSVILPLKEKE